MRGKTYFTKCWLKICVTNILNNMALSQVRICRPLLWISPIFMKDAQCTRCWIEWKINFYFFRYGCLYSKWTKNLATKKKFVIKSDQIYRKDADYSENCLFCATFRFGRFWCLWPHVCKRLKRFMRNMPLTLTSEAKVLNPKTCGVLGRCPGGR